jgi:hypothetical protein
MAADKSGSVPTKGQSDAPASGGGSFESGLTIKQNFKAPAIDETKYGQPATNPIMKVGE